MWCKNIIAVYPARDDYGEEFPVTERYVYCICACYEDGHNEPLPGTYENVREVRKEASRYAKIISKLNDVKCKLNPLSEVNIICDAERSKKYNDKRKAYMQEQKQKKYIKMMTNTRGGREFY